MHLNKIIAKHIGYPLQDYVRGTNILKTLAHLKESQYWDEQRIYDYQLQKLKAIIDYSKRNVPYYEELFNNIKLSSKDIRTLDDINKIPILTKELFRLNNDKLISKEYNKFKVKKGKTGGTTGVPVRVLKDEINRSFTWASYYRWYEWMGLNYYDKVATFWGAKTVLTNSIIKKAVSNIQNHIQNQIVINSFEMTDELMHDYYHTIHKSKPLLLKGYLSAIIHFGEFLEKNKLNLPSIVAISSTTESLLPHNRAYIEKVYGVPIYDQYGCGEVSAISYECSKHNGLHINQEHVICEILDDNDKQVFNRTGRVVATDLDNFVMPFIRYENGDLATMSDIKCECGVNQPLMKSIQGRSIDTVVLKGGKKVHGVFFTDILYELGILTDTFPRFQIYQDEPAKIEFRIEIQKKLPSVLKNKIEAACLSFLDDITIVEMEKLPLTKSGKFSYIINDIK